MLPALCYGLLIVAWAVDLVTPQAFVAAILLNGPIALSSLALERRLTARLIVLAEIANVVSGYVNGVQAGYHWDGIAVGDRLLAAASFVLVGYLSIKTQEYAREAGESTGRARQVRVEQALREATGRVRDSLNVELVLRGILRESMRLIDASRALLIYRDSSLEAPLVMSLDALEGDVAIERKRLSSELVSLAERVRQTIGSLHVGSDHVLGRLILDALDASDAIAIAIPASGELECVLVECATDERPFVADAGTVLYTFAEQAGTAIEQARLFTRLGSQNDEIMSQRDEIARRGEVIRDIVYALAHDMRTPLAANDVTMKQALSGAFGELPDRYKDVLRAALAANEDERRIIETLLLVARYEAGEESSVREALDFSALVDRVVGELHPIGEVKGVSIRVDMPDRPLPVLGDSSELKRALVNLVANAIEATPKSGNVCVRGERRDGNVVISVEDDGYGVPLEKRHRLFQRFAGGATPGAGTGLGLYIVRRIVEKHGGRVNYEPMQPHGSIFSLEIPAHG